MDRKKNFEEIKPFILKVNKEFKPTQIILFGSRARGNAWNRSDYDFIIVSEKFKSVHWLKRITKVVKLWDLNQDIDILPYTKEEFEEKKENSSTIRTAVKEGITISK
ncbi:nucleotidyltransferase domain-containing protein [Candidatus Woesearchaeota archaeon]|nr:nucleotidyltransferase domain-containing protein [Candidatus Woesearchaeota archaeon]